MMPDNDTPDAKAQANRARDRFAFLTGLRAGGVILMLIGIWMLLGGSVAGNSGSGGVLFGLGAVIGLVVPTLLGKRWKTRP